MTAAALALGASSSLAATATFNIAATGAAEVTAGGVPNQGDADGFANGTVLLDSGTGGSTGFAVFDLVIGNIATPLGGWHIHQAPATTNGPIRLDFGNAEASRNGSLLQATKTGLSSTQIDAIIANPIGFYFNLHNSPFPGGAVRSQLPEPGAISLVALSAFGLVRRRR